MSCNNSIPISDIIAAVAEQLSKQYVASENGVAKNLTLKGDVALDSAAKASLCEALSNCFDDKFVTDFAIDDTQSHIVLTLSSGEKHRISKEELAAFLKPELKGVDGKSAYDLWLEAGNTGSKQDFLRSLKGDKGDKGDTGPQGPVGPVGPQGPKGDTPTIDLKLEGNNLSLVVDGVEDTVTLPTTGGTPLTITDVNVTEFTDPLGNPVSTLGLLTFGDVIYDINKVGRIEGTDWVVFGINEYIPL